MSLFFIIAALNYIFLVIFSLRVTRFRKDSFIWYFLGTIAASLSLYVLVPELPIIEYFQNFWIGYLVAIVGILSLLIVNRNQTTKKLSLKSSVIFASVFLYCCLLTIAIIYLNLIHSLIQL